MDDWTTILDFPDYSINRLGDVRRDSNGRLLHYKMNQYNVVYVGLMRQHRQCQRSVALLVLNAFVPKPFEHMDTPIHMNGNKVDNRVVNLAWRPRWFAIQYNRQFRIPYREPIAEPIKDLETNEQFLDSFECATQFGLLERDVVLSILNRTYVWPTYQQFGLV